MTFKRIVCLLLAFAITTVCLAGCSKSNVQYYDENAQIFVVDSGVIAENEKLEFSWNNDLKCILLKNKETGKVWSDIPYDAVLRGEAFSTLTIRVLDTQSYQWDVISSGELYNNNKISCEKKENGIRVTYYYDDLKIAIPVEYTLREDSLLISIDGSKIIEGDEQHKLYYVSPAANLCSVLQGEGNKESQENTADNAGTTNATANKTVIDEDKYIFTPFGTGSIISTGSLPDGKRKIDDFARNVAVLSTTNSTDSPDDSGFQVFGIKDKSDALLGICEDTAGAVAIHVLAGERQSDYSSVYPIYYFVDRDDVKGRAERSGDISQLSERTESVVSVAFYPLSGDDADYNGMARRYRKYLIDSGYVKENTGDVDFSSPYAITLMGGVRTTQSVAGVPVTSLKAMTTYSAAKDIISDIMSATGQKPVVRLSGYGKSGINIGEVGGGFTFASSLGSDSDREALEDYCSDNNISLYTQFELLRYSESGSGFSFSFDSAQTATLHAAEQNGLTIPLRQYDANNVSRLLARRNISSAVDKLISFINKDSVSGVNLTSLGRISYSDYSDGIKYSITSGMNADTKEYVKRIIDSGHKVSGSASTYFAAGLMSAVFDSPLETSGKYQVEADIPFYQMVFSGITPLYSASINNDSNPARKIMLAAASGVGLGFAVVDNFEKNYMQGNAYSLYASDYGKNKDSIVKAVKNYAEIYKAVAGVPIARYELVDRNVSKTTFENGVVVYANHLSSSVNSPVGVLEGYGFKMGSEG